MNISELNKGNFLIFAIKNYNNPNCTTEEEFNEDLKRFKYVKRWLKRYHETGTIKTHLVLNHILIIFNSWQDASLAMFFYKIEPTYWSYLKSFFVYLNRIPEYPHTMLHDIEEDINILRELQGL